MIAETLLFITFTGLIGAVYAWLRYIYSYWVRNKVPFAETTPFLGSLKDLLCMKVGFGEAISNLYNHPKAKDQPIFGIHILHTPGLILRDPELIKQIMVKDFSKFSNKYTTPDPHDFLGAQNLFFAKNPEWKAIRTKLTPVFTSGKLKQMFPLITKVGDKLDSYLLTHSIDPHTKSMELEIKDTSSSFSNDVIATVAFGVQVNSFKNPENDFRLSGKRIFKTSPYRALEFFIIFFVPKLVSIVGCRVFSGETSKFFQETICHVIRERAKSGETRNDLIDTLLTFKKEADTNPEKKQFATENFMVAQAAIFFTAGFETSSSTIAFALYELSKNQEIQKKLREEIRQVLKDNDGQLVYDTLLNMKLLNAVILETLRLYPSVPLLERKCSLPAGEELYPLGPISNFSIPNGMPIYVSNFALQRDPKYFSEPTKFRPERFLPQNKANVNPYVYMPFGTGPRNCIGERLGLMQSRVGIISILRNHYVETSPRSVPEIVFDPKSVTLQSGDGIYMNLVRDPLL